MRSQWTSRTGLNLVRLAALWALTGVLGLGAESGRPVIRTFGSVEVHAKGPVLAFAEAADGSLFVGSNQLVVFDGVRWQLVDVPGAYGFRALAGSGARIWVGASGAIGYAERDERGAWNFTSLAPALIRSHLAMPPAIRWIAQTEQGAIFGTEREILRWDGARFEAWPIAGVAAAESHAALVFQPGAGVFRLGDRGPPRLIVPQLELPPAAIRWLLPATRVSATAEGGTGLIIGTDAGVFRLGAHGPERLAAVSEAVARFESGQAVRTEHGTVAIGTAGNGVILATAQDGILGRLDRQTGLPTEAIHALWSDRRGALWLGLDSGCARLDHYSAASEFDAREGLELGLPRRTVSAGAVTYVLTDQKLYRLMPGSAPNHFQPVEGLPPELTDAAAWGPELWVAGESGLWRIAGPGSAPIRVSAQACQRLAAAPWLPGVIAVSGGKPEAYASDSQGGWHRQELAPGEANDPQLVGAPSARAQAAADIARVHPPLLNGPASVQSKTVPAPAFAPPLMGSAGAGRQALCIGADPEIWTVNDGGSVERWRLKRAAPGGAWRAAERTWFTAGAGLPAGIAASGVARIGRRIFVLSPGVVLELRPDGQFSPVPEMAGWTILADAHLESSSEADWLGRRSGLPDSAPLDILRVVAPGLPGTAVESAPLRATGLDTLGEISSFDLLAQGGEPTGWLGGEGGVLRLNWAEMIPAGVMRDLSLREVRIDDETGLPLRPAKRPELKFGLRSIEFGFSAAQPMELEPTVYYQTRLEGAERDWSVPQRKTSREYTALSPGQYVFMVRRFDRYGRFGAPLAYPFAVLPPWYQRWPARAIAAALLLAGAWGLYRWRIRALRHQAERLNRLVAKRTRELELSNTAKSEFLENISHEIRNPLNGIIGLTRLLHRAPLGPEERQLAQSLEASAEHLRRVSEDVLDLSKAEFGSVEVAAEPFSLGAMLREIANHHRATAQRSESELRLEVGGLKTDLVRGDEPKLRTIVSNFVANAVKYAPDGPIEIHADSSDIEEAEGAGFAEIFIAVTDAGPGVAGDEQELIFQKFVRGEGAKSSGAPGSGIGLATCRALARRMGGDVSVESPPSEPLPGADGLGAAFQFWIRLPKVGSPLPGTGVLGSRPPLVAETAGFAFPSQPDGLLGAAHRSTPGLAGFEFPEGAETALIVDDEPYNRQVIAGLVRELGYCPIAVSNAAEALDAMRGSVVDAILLDLELSGEKGLDGVPALRAARAGRIALILAISGSDSGAVRERCQAAGLDGFLLKPVSLPQLQAALATAREQSFRLYARGAGKSVADAQSEFATALRQESALLAAAGASDDREALKSAGHRIRTLAALGRMAALNVLAGELEAAALEATTADLLRLAAALQQRLSRDCQ